jgi:hypothetical protein
MPPVFNCEPNIYLRHLQFLYDLYENKSSNKSSYELSEIDTQVIFIEPILYFIGYDIFNPSIIQRAKRNDTDYFDIKIQNASESQDKNTIIGIEVKSLTSPEYNVDKLASNKIIGILKEETGKNINNENGDGVGQLRRYCANFFQKDNNITIIPILTNGYEWTIFEASFYNNEKKHDEPVLRSDIKLQIKINEEGFIKK